ncbi:hypothetical protein DFH09DRAFT_1460906 [Mycena vulgaris]|nr:hypothetical protein DFH09DRAFT_1460906 [Mycena vulgaris]
MSGNRDGSHWYAGGFSQYNARFAPHYNGFTDTPNTFAPGIPSDTWPGDLHNSNTDWRNAPAARRVQMDEWQSLWRLAGAGSSALQRTSIEYITLSDENTALALELDEVRAQLAALIQRYDDLNFTHRLLFKNYLEATRDLSAVMQQQFATRNGSRLNAPVPWATVGEHPTAASSAARRDLPDFLTRIAPVQALPGFQMALQPIVADVPESTPLEPTSLPQQLHLRSDEDSDDEVELEESELTRA